MSKRYEILFDWQKGDFQPVEIRARLLAAQVAGKYVPCTFARAEFTAEPADIVTIESRLEDQTAIAAIRLADSFYARPDFWDQIKKPISVTLHATPENSQASPVVETCQVAVQSPRPTIHWMKQDDPSTKDGKIEIPAEVNEQFVLQVWLNQFDPQQRSVTYDPDEVEFSHWSEFPKEVLANQGPPAMDVKQGKNRDLTTWVMKVSLPDGNFPRLEPPVENTIRVKAWARGTIQRENGGIKPLSGAEMLADEVHVPVVLSPVKLTARLAEPMPIPANGRQTELLLQVLQEKDERPAKGIKLSWELAQVANRPRGSLLPEGGTTDDQGQVRIAYTTPELLYHPGIDLTEKLCVFRGEGASRSELAEIELALAPAISLKLEAEKTKDCEYGLSGLAAEPVEINLDADLVVNEKVKGIQLSLPLPLDGLETPYKVQQAGFKMHIGDGKGNWQLAGENPVKEIAPGQYVWRAPELKYPGMDGPGLYALPEEQSPEAVYNEVVKGAVDLYSRNRIGQYCPKAILRDDFYQKLVDYPRDIFARQLAEKPPDAVCQAMSGLDLLGLASGYLSQTASIREGLWGRFSDNVSGFLKDVLSFCLNLYDVGGKLAEGARGVGRWIDQMLEGSYLKRFIAWLYDTFRGKLRGFSDTLLEYFTSLTPKLNRAWKRVQVSVMRQFKDVAEFIDRLVHYDVPDTTANDFVKRMTDLVSMLFESLGHLCKLAGRLVLWLATMVWQMVVGLTSGLLHDLFELMPNSSHAMEALARLLNVSVDTAQKLFERWLNLVLGEELADFVEKALDDPNASVSSLMNRLDLLYRFATQILEQGPYTDASNLSVPTPAGSKAQRYKDIMAEMRNLQLESEVNQAEVDYWMDFIDLAVYYGGLAAVLIGSLPSLGLAAPALMAALTNVEMAVSAVKAVCVRIPQTAYTMSFMLAVVMTYASTTYELTRV